MGLPVYSRLTGSALFKPFDQDICYMRFFIHLKFINIMFLVLVAYGAAIKAKF